MFDIEGGRLGALQLRAFRKGLQEIPVVELGLGGQRYKCRTRRRDLVGIARTGHETARRHRA